MIKGIRLKKWQRNGEEEKEKRRGKRKEKKKKKEEEHLIRPFAGRYTSKVILASKL